MDSAPPSIVEQPIWGRWGTLLIALLVAVGLYAGGAWYRIKARETDSREVARLRDMHQAVAEEANAKDPFSRVETYIAAFPHGLFLEQEGTEGLWAISVAMDWKEAGTDERRLGLATGMIRRFDALKAYQIESLEIVNPSGTERELAERLLQRSRSGESSAAK